MCHNELATINLELFLDFDPSADICLNILLFDQIMNHKRHQINANMKILQFGMFIMCLAVTTD
jgi:hypothetical protein